MPVDPPSPKRRGAHRLLALLALAAFLSALPVAAVAHAAEPVTLAEWLRTIYVTPDREVDRVDPAVALATPSPPPPALQQSSEQIPPKEPVLRNRVPDGWLRRNPWSPRKRDRLLPPS